MALTRITEDNIQPGSITANSLDASVSVTSGEYANAAYGHANSVFDLANTVNANATSTSVYANAAFTAANNAVDSYVRDAANSASSYANSGFGKANTANTLAQSAYDAANNAVDSYVRDAANSASSYANSAYTEANTRATISYVDNAVANLVNSAPATLDTLNELATALNNDPNFATTIATNIGIIGVYANSAYLQANTPSQVANSASSYANGAFTAANNAVDSYVRDAANAASSYANSAYLQANTPSQVANSASVYANAAYLQANTPSQVANAASSYANGAFTAANNAVDSYVRDAANAASSYANSAYLQANTVYDYANTLVSGGSFALSVIHDSFTANGTSNTFTLSTTPLDENYTLITLDGVVQHKSAYNIVSSNIVFSGIPDANTQIDVMIFTGANASYQEAYDHANSAYDAANTAGAEIQVNDFRAASVEAGLSTVEYAVTVAGPQGGDSGNKYLLDGVYRLAPNLVVGYTYVFNQDDLTNVYFPNANGTTLNPHPLNFSADNLNGLLGGGTSYLTNVQYFLNGVAGNTSVYNGDAFNTANTRRVHITVTNDTPVTLYYWCYNHQAMGASITVANPGVSSGGGVSNAAVYIYDTTVTSNIVLSEGQNGLSVGPITIANNVSINIAANSRWLIL